VVRKVRLDLRTRKKITEEVSKRYRKAQKKERGRILDEFCALTGYNRSYAACILRKKPGPRKGKRTLPVRPARTGRQGRRPVYTNDVRQALLKIWAILNYPCGRRLVAVLPQVTEKLEKFGEISISDAVREKLLSISASTADRLLASERRKIQIKSRSKTKPGTLLKHQIPIKTFADWDDARPGFLEIDLVGHDGGSACGEYCQSLDCVDVSSGWTEMRACRNKAQRWVFEAVDDVRASLPFPLAGVDSDNGGEFINEPLAKYCEAGSITFTRSRPYRKNDSCFVEQKNYTAVRSYVGYLRYDSDEQLALLGELYRVLRPYLNFFQPQMRLVEKVREGSKVRKRYDQPRTPYQRLLESPHLDELAKRKLRRQYAGLNPAELARRINTLQRRLYRISTPQVAGQTKEAGAEPGKRQVAPQSGERGPQGFPIPEGDRGQIRQERKRATGATETTAASFIAPL